MSHYSLNTLGIMLTEKNTVNYQFKESILPQPCRLKNNNIILFMNFPKEISLRYTEATEMQKKNDKRYRAYKSAVKTISKAKRIVTCNSCLLLHKRKRSVRMRYQCIAATYPLNDSAPSFPNGILFLLCLHWKR